jgi:hypothetical protein
MTKWPQQPKVAGQRARRCYQVRVENDDQGVAVWPFEAVYTVQAQVVDEQDVSGFEWLQLLADAKGSRTGERTENFQALMPCHGYGAETCWKLVQPHRKGERRIKGQVVALCGIHSFQDLE